MSVAAERTQAKLNAILGRVGRSGPVSLMTTPVVVSILFRIAVMDLFALIVGRDILAAIQIKPRLRLTFVVQSKIKFVTEDSDTCKAEGTSCGRSWENCCPELDCVESLNGGKLCHDCSNYPIAACNVI